MEVSIDRVTGGVPSLQQKKWIWCWVSC